MKTSTRGNLIVIFFPIDISYVFKSIIMVSYQRLK